MSEAQSKIAFPGPAFYWASVAGVALLVLLLTAQKSWPWPASSTLLVFASFVCALTDIFRGKILNCVVIPLLLILLAMNAWVDWAAPSLQAAWGTIGLGGSVLGIVVCFLAMFFPYSLGEIGAGDVKLAMLIGAVLGAQSGIVTLCFAVVFAAVFGILFAVSKYGFVFFHHLFARSLTVVAHASNDLRADKKKARLQIPMAPAFFLAVLGTLTRFWEQWIG